MKKKIAVVIPTYKQKLSEAEKISMSQAMRVLRNYDKYFMIPCSLEYSYDVQDMEELRVEDKWFRDIHSYNMLLTDIRFYEHFNDYEYILIYQLDAFVFDDSLDYFCNLGYDYIGAPWINGKFYYKDSKQMIWYVGNGGLSLRRVESCTRILNQNQNPLVNYRIPEDLFFSTMDGSDFHVAPLDKALEFSFEMNVKECYEKNGNKLPFGCHAWHRYNLPFWKPWIERYGYRIPEEMGRNGQEDDSYFVRTRMKEITNFWLNKYKKEDVKTLLSGLFCSVEEKYAIWGAGYWGQMLCRMMKDVGIEFQVFIDKQKSLDNSCILGCDIIMPEKLQDMVSKYKIIVAVKNGYREIGAFLDSIGYQYRRNYIYMKDIDIPMAF